MRRTLRQRGVTLVYATFAMVGVFGFVSLAVDFGRAQLIKNQARSCADATAIALLDAWVDSGYDVNAAAAAGYAMVAANPVESTTSPAPTVTFVPGTWNPATRVFSPTDMLYTNVVAGQPAAKVIISRTAAAGNPVALYFGRVIGMPTLDIQASAIGTLIDTDATGTTLASTANPYLAGMPAGTTSRWGDSTSNANAHQITAITVVPGTWITITGATGTTSIVPGTTGYYGPEGEAGRNLHHGENWDHTDMGIGSENGIADAVMPACALYGMFLDDSAPTSSAAPSTVDWTQPGVADQPTYTSLQLKAPFLIGDGQTSGGTVQRFQVPLGATRLYLGVWDGVMQSNNGGSITATVTRKRKVQLVK